MVNTLQQRLLDSEKDGKAAHERLEEVRREHEAKTGDLSAKLKEAQETISLLENSAKSPEGEIQDSQIRRQNKPHFVPHPHILLAASELEAKVLELGEYIESKDKEMADNIAEWQQHCVDLEKQNTELSNKLEALARDPDYEGSPQGTLFRGWHCVRCILLASHMRTERQ